MLYCVNIIPQDNYYRLFMLKTFHLKHLYKRGRFKVEDFRKQHCISDPFKVNKLRRGVGHRVMEHTSKRKFLGFSQNHISLRGLLK